MSLEAPGLTCATCHGVLYPDEARRTDDGWHHATPSVCAGTSRRERTRARLEDIQWMTETGETFSGVAKRLGISNSALDTWLRNQRQKDIHRRLLDRDPGALNNGKRQAKAA